MKRVFGVLLTTGIIGFTQSPLSAFAQTTASDTSSLHQLASTITSALEEVAIRPQTCADIPFAALGAAANAAGQALGNNATASVDAAKLTEQVLSGISLLSMRCRGIDPWAQEQTAPRTDSI